MTALGQDLAAVISPPRIGPDEFWVADPTPEQAAKEQRRKWSKAWLDAQRPYIPTVNPICLRGTGSGRVIVSPEPPASANAELKAASIIPPHP